MAKIFDLFIDSQTRVCQARRQLDRLKEDRERQREIQDGINAKKRDRFIDKMRKALKKSALEAVDKEQFIDEINFERLKKYDVKNYMSYRAVNHAAAKRLFALAAGKPLKNFESEQAIFAAQKQGLEKIKSKREAYVAKLEGAKRQYLESHPVSEGAEQSFSDLRNSLLEEYGNRLKELEEQGNAKVEKRVSAIDKRIEKCTERYNLLKKESDAKQKVVLPEDVVLRVNGLKMYFGGLKAVDDLSFEIKKGEIFGLIGPNGAGKTTVFNCITRFYTATDGEIYFNNKYGETVDMNRFKVHDVILQGISRTFQNVELVKEISVLDNLLIACTRDYRTNLLFQALGLPMLKKEEALMRAKAMKILDFMGLKSYAGWLAFGLPYGILKKVEIARALMAGATLIIMDEPAAGLNDSETAELTRLIRRIRDEFNVSILLVEHDMSLVMNVCDRICAISFGKLLAIGTPSEIQNDQAVREAYLGTEEA